MAETRSDILQGTLDLMVLKTLDAMGPMRCWRGSREPGTGRRGAWSFRIAAWRVRGSLEQEIRSTTGDQEIRSFFEE